jgi:hypothetical protein
MILEFQNSKGQRREISKPHNIKEMWSDINKFLDEHNFTSYYSRINFEENEWEIDVGSHTEFFYVTEFTDNDLQELRKD